jgi:prevent-host-death family protein
MIDTLSVSRISTFTSREFNQDTSRAKKAAADGPVFITDRGRPAHVLLNIEEYEKLTGKKESIIDQLSMPEADQIEFEIPDMRGEIHKPFDFS